MGIDIYVLGDSDKELPYTYFKDLTKLSAYSSEDRNRNDTWSVICVHMSTSGTTGNMTKRERWRENSGC